MEKVVYSPSGIAFTQEVFNSLKYAYNVALQQEQTTFKFRKRKLNIEFAKYLIEYLSTIFK